MTKTMNNQDERTLIDEAVTWSSVLWRSLFFFSLLLLLLYVGFNWPGY
jgi:hypothetical protein